MIKQNNDKQKWWHGSSVYQIYPRSFYDSNGDGVGDLPGITKKLDYLGGTPESLGVNAIWISPFYRSPMADFGYDVSDHKDVDPVFGTLSDFDELIREAHARGLRVLIDFVPNHTSNLHEWFVRSSRIKDSKYRDWYVWRNGSAEGGPPNNWLSIFGGSAWEKDVQTGQYYLHTFLKEQPDLNWDNPEVREAMKDVARFWLDKGVDGLRVDAVSWLSKDTKLRDDPLNPYYHESEDPYFKVLHHFSTQGPKLFDYLNELVDVLAEYGNRFMVTEAYPERPNEINHYLNFYSKLRHNICAPINFECITFPWDAHTYRGFIDHYQETLHPKQPPIYNMGNHDKPRLASRIGPASAKTAAMLLLSLPGIPFIYYGDELGMHDVGVPKNLLKDHVAQMGGISRDSARTPMQWSAQTNAGFSKGKPWLPLAKDFEKANYEVESSDQSSFFNLYKQLLELRNRSDVLKYGSYRSLNLPSHIYGFVRESNMHRLSVILNFSGSKVSVVSKAIKGRVILSTYQDAGHPIALGGVVLRPHEGVIIEAV